MGFRCVLFDVDGTLVDSNDQHARAWVDAFREFGFDVPYERARKLVGMGGDKLIPAAIGLSKDEPRGKALAERRAAIFREQYLKEVRPFPRVRELVDRLRAEGLTVAVATSAQPDELRPLLRIAGLEELLDDSTSAEDAERSKPDPDIVAAALRQARCPAAEAVMVGDTPYDVEAARGAGLPTIALRSGGWDDEGLGGAIAIYDGAADLLSQFDRSPLARAAERARP
jgi:HAD superfamily hydrolase (TIGR01509 family)